MRAALRGYAGKAEVPSAALLDPGGARVILGSQPDARVAPILPRPDTLFGPRGACLAQPGGPLLVCDTGHHRLLIWKGAPCQDGVPADLVVGQVDFCSEGRNAKGDAGPATLNVPTGVAINANVLAVADSWNNRVLLWNGVPTRCNQPADIVLGQADFRSTGEALLKWPSAVAFHDGHLYVADTGHRRVLRWNTIPRQSATPPDSTIGDDMRWPHAVAAARGQWFVADAGANRVVTQGPAIEADFNMPYGVTMLGECLVVADTANSRLLGFDLAGARTRRLAGQCTLNDKGENRWGMARRDSLCWPYGVSGCGSTLVVADSGNNRVLLWEKA